MGHALAVTIFKIILQVGCNVPILWVLNQIKHLVKVTNQQVGSQEDNAQVFSAVNTMLTLSP